MNYVRKKYISVDEMYILLDDHSSLTETFSSNYMGSFLQLSKDKLINRKGKLISISGIMRQMSTIIAVTAVLVLGLIGTNGVSLNKDLILTLAEKQTLDKFKQEMLPLLTHDWMKQEIYLVRWLRVKDFDLDAAKDMLKKNLDWRKENKIDTILSEDFGSFGKQYDHIFEGHDKQNRPVFITNIGEWDARKAVTSGQSDRLRRVIYHGFEKISAMLRKMQDEGKAVTQYYHIYNLAGFNLYQHGCLQCITLILDVVRVHDNYYPGSSHKTVFINTPQTFLPILETFKAAARPELRAALQVLGTNRREWEAKLLQDIDKDQLVAELGGTLLYSYE